MCFLENFLLIERFPSLHLAYLLRYGSQVVFELFSLKSELALGDRLRILMIYLINVYYLSLLVLLVW